MAWIFLASADCLRICLCTPSHFGSSTHPANIATATIATTAINPTMLLLSILYYLLLVLFSYMQSPETPRPQVQSPHTAIPCCPPAPSADRITHTRTRLLRLYMTYTARRYANSATKTNGMTESNILDGAYQQTEQNVYSASIVAASILMIVFMI